eukprot:g4489.t1
MRAIARMTATLFSCLLARLHAITVDVSNGAEHPDFRGIPIEVVNQMQANSPQFESLTKGMVSG